MNYLALSSPIVGVADTSPTRRTRPFCCYRDISPVSAGESTPKEEVKTYVILNDSEESHRRTDRHILLTLVVGYFACAQYDVLFLFVIASMPSEQTCLQGFASDGIHKALAFFIKMRKTIVLTR